METLTRGGRRVEQMDITDAFNYGMAVWAASGSVRTAPFERVVRLDAVSEGREKDANYLQCLALANWALGDRDSAVTLALRAREAGRSSRLAFSCWQYRYVRGSAFEEDTDEILAMVQGDENRVPAFMGRTGGDGGDHS